MKPYRERVEVFGYEIVGLTPMVLAGFYGGDGTYGVPGGGLESVETPEAAAVRELMEETGYYLTNAVIAPVGHLDHEWNDYVQQKHDYVYRGSRSYYVCGRLLGRDNFGSGEHDIQDLKMRPLEEIILGYQRSIIEKPEHAERLWKRLRVCMWMHNMIASGRDLVDAVK